MRIFSRLVVVALCGLFSQQLLSISSLANNDPYPIYSAVFDPYLMHWTKQYLKGCNNQTYSNERWAIAISPFYQSASKGRTFDKQKANLGDLQGTYDMLALTYGGIPEGCNPYTNPDGSFTSLGKAKLCIFSDLFSQLTDPNPDTIISNTSYCEFILTDSASDIGHFSLPIRYRKVGVRLQADVKFGSNFGLTMQAGVSEIRQTLRTLIDQGEGRGPLCCGTDLGADTDCFPCNLSQQPFQNNFFRNIPVCETDSIGSCTSVVFSVCNSQDTNPSTTACTTPYTQIELKLMNQERARKIFRELGLDDCDYEETSFEDVRFILWWSKLYELNKHDAQDYPWLFVIPGISFNAIAPAAKEKDRTKLLGVPFGNDKFWSVGFDAKLYIDFVESVQIGFGCGMNYFFERQVENYRLPTFFMQQGIFPCKACVNVKPGYNFNCNGVLSAYHFLDRLSAYTEWVMVKHEDDRITKICPPKDKCNPCPDPCEPCIKTKDLECCPQPDAIYTPELINKAECITKFTSHVVNASLYYDISPNIALGFLFQFPLAQRNAYKATTYLATFRAVF